MPLAQTVIDRIRDEIGMDLDVTDEAAVPPAPLGDLETIYNDVNRGNLSVLRTALLVYRRRLNSMQSRSFDATAGGTLMARSQRVRMLQRRVKELEILVDFTLKGTNTTVLSTHQQVEESAEF